MIEFGPQNTVSKLFFKNLFSFSRYRPSKSGTSAGSIHSRFHSFSENNNRETFVCDVTSDQSSIISTERSDLRDCKASGNCYVRWFLEEIMVYRVAYDCLMIVGRSKAFHPTNFKQTPKKNAGRNDLRASSSKTTPNLILQS